MKNSTVGSTSARSSGRKATPLVSASSCDHHERPEVLTESSESVSPAWRRLHNTGKPRATKVRPYRRDGTADPELNDRPWFESNQRAEVAPLTEPEFRPADDAGHLTTDAPPNIGSGEPTVDEPENRKQKRLSSGRSPPVQTTLRLTKKKTAAHLVRRVAPKGSSSERRTNNATSRSDHSSARDISTTESSVSQGRRHSRIRAPLTHYVTAALEKLQASPPHSGTAPAIPPESAWKYLLLVPSSPFWVLWNSLHLLALGYICTVVPFMTALPSVTFGTAGDWSERVNRAIDLFYILDVVVNFRACFIDAETGEIVTSPQRVARHYVVSSIAWFTFDIVMAFPFDLLLGGDAVGHHGSAMTFTFVRILRLVRLAKLLRILKLRPLMDFCEDTLGVSRNKLIVVQLVLTIAFVAHLTACGFVLAGTLGPSAVVTTGTPPIQPSWIQRNELANAPAGEIYVAALYWAFTMMTTVGFGDIVPVTLAERVYSILAMVISAGTYAYVIASMSTIVALMNLQQSRYYERINELNAYMASRHLPPGLQLRTRQFFRYYLTKKSVFDEHALLDILPPNLREELVEHDVKTAMRHIRFFHELTDRGFLGHVALFLRPVFFPPTSVIVKVRDHAGEMYFISKGFCEVLTEKGQVNHTVSPDHSPLRKAQRLSPTKAFTRASPARSELVAEHGELRVASLRDGEYFGEMALLCDASRHRRFASVRAVTYCELHSLSYSQLGPALDKYLSVWKQLNREAQVRRVQLEDLQRTAIEQVILSHS